MKKLLLVFGICLLTGCEPEAPIVTNIPVVTKLRVEIPKKPKLLSASLNLNSTPMQIEKAHCTDLDALTNYSSELIFILKSVQS